MSPCIVAQEFKDVHAFAARLYSIDTTRDLFRSDEDRRYLEKFLHQNSPNIPPHLDSLLADAKDKKRYGQLAILYQILVNRAFYQPDYSKEDAFKQLSEYVRFLEKKNQTAYALRLKADYARHYNMPVAERHKLFNEAIIEMQKEGLYDLAAVTALNQAEAFGLQDITGATLAQSYKSIRQAVELCEQHPIHYLIKAKAYGTMAFLFYNKGSYEKAEDYAKRAVQIYSDNEIIDNNVFWQINILALNRRKSGRFDSSLVIYRRAMKLFEKSASKVWEGIYYGNIGWAHSYVGRHDSAVYYFTKNIELSKSYGELENFTLGYIKLAEAYIRLGDLKSGKIMLDSAEKYVTMHGFNRLTMRHYESTRLQYFFNTNQPKRASEAFQNLSALQDSIERQRQLENIREAELSSELIRIEKELDQVHMEKQLADNSIKLYNRLIIMGVLFLAIMLGASFALYKLYRSLSVANAALKRNNESKNRLFSILAHDLRSPMAVIITGLRMMEKKSKIELELDDTLVEQLRRVSENFLTMLDNTLYWARSQMGGLGVKQSPFAPARKLAPELNNALELAAAKGINIEVDIDENQLMTSDISLLSIVVRNLLSNAIKFTNKGGSIVISLKKSDLNLQHWLLTVQDDGVGMTIEQLEQLYVLKNKNSSRGTEGEKGTGMGMVLVKDLVELLNVKLEVQSQKGQGTKVLCYFG